ncbi:MAG TPA: PLP-dependent aminotransferase family protein [Alphaproteobacteria bacterium]|nr:PLP-dependent aminotransferase family protein [Alphaproteobacteria bacterium]
MPRDNPPMRIELDRRLGLPAYRQIYERIRKAILSGNLPPGAKLPSTRSLSSQLAIARGTVELAYEMLAGEGYILGRAAAGTIVDPELAQKIALPARRAREAAPHSASPRDFPPPTPPLPFQLGVPAFDAFPRKLWSRLVARRARGLSTLAMVYQDPAGYAPLRQAIVNYLAIARGIACTVEQVFVTAGFQGAIGLITHALLGKGDAVWVEDPGYFRAREAFILAGAAPVPVPVDSDGLDVAAGIARAPAARFAMVTPSHQSPLGVSLALPRRLALLAWATSRDAWIIEDDYDSEFRYRGRPLPALKSLDAAGRVLYVGTFSKVLLPGLRLGYLVVPEGETRRFARAADLLAPIPSLLDQMTVADFIAQGHFARHIKRMRRLYGERRAALVEALAGQLGDRLTIADATGGMQLLARLAPGEDDLALAARAHARGLAPTALSATAVEAKCGPGLLLGFTNIPAASATRAARRLREALED